MPNNKQIIPKPDLEIVLNGGSPVMDAATIPVRFFFSDEVAKKQPTYMVFFEQNAAESREDFGGTRGNRYYCEVKEAVKVIQMFKKGYHRLMVIALSGVHAKSAAENLLYKTDGNYLNSISYSEIEDGTYIEKIKKSLINGTSAYWREAFVAATAAEFSVPEKLFAKEPPAWLKKWVNKWFRSEARDECLFKKRAILAFTAQPPVMALFYFFRTIFASLFCLYVLLSSFFTWFFGYQTKNLFWMLKRAWKLQSLHDRLNQDDSNHHMAVFRCSWYKNKYPKLADGTYKKSTVEMKTAPIAVIGWTVLTVVGIFSAYKLITNNWETISILILIAIYLIAAVGVIYLLVKAWQIFAKTKTGEIYLRNRRNKAEIRAQEKDAKKRNKELSYQHWLEEFLSVKRKPAEVNLAHIPEPIDTKARYIQKFTISYWTTKIKVCKPYSH